MNHVCVLTLNSRSLFNPSCLVRLFNYGNKHIEIWDKSLKDRQPKYADIQNKASTSNGKPNVECGMCKC